MVSSRNVCFRCVVTLHAALGLEAIRLISRVPVEASIVYFTSQKGSTKEARTSKKLFHPLDSIKHLLSSQSLNDHYAFLSYLSVLPVQLWAGPPEPGGAGDVQQIGHSHLPLALDQWEVERIISFMDSGDEQIRRLVGIFQISLLLRILTSQSADINRLNARVKFHSRKVVRRPYITTHNRTQHI